MQLRGNAARPRPKRLNRSEPRHMLKDWKHIVAVQVVPIPMREHHRRPQIGDGGRRWSRVSVEAYWPPGIEMQNRAILLVSQGDEARLADITLTCP